MRLDQALVERGLAMTRSRARDAIVRGLVTIDGRAANKPGDLVDTSAKLDISGDSGLAYVSRGALKLQAALDEMGFDPTDRNALDIGASTGGFTEVLLERGARKVYSVDVGRGQLHERLRMNSRVIALEATDARTVTQQDIADPITAIVADVSFISLSLVLPPVLKLAQPGCWLTVLIKPQFEVGPDHLGKNGIVRDEATQLRAVDRITRVVQEQTVWRIVGSMRSPIEGGSGNREYLLGAICDA